MNSIVVGLHEAYAAALQAYLAGGGEAALSQGYELGRRAVAESQGPLAMVALHGRVLAEVLGRLRPTQRADAGIRACEFLAECLSPFEMTHRGFQEANARLNDLNERLQAILAERTRELRNAEAKYRAHVEQIPAITYIESLKTRETVYISPQIEALLGFAQQEWLEDSDRLARQLHPNDRSRVLQELGRLREGSEPIRSEYRLLRKDGKEVWVRHEANVVRDEGGRLLYIQGVIIDTTERMRAERIRIESEDRFRKIFDHSTDAILVTNLQNGRLLDVNSRAVSLTRTPREALLSVALPALFPGTAARLQDFVRTVLEKGTAWADDLTLTTSDAQEVPAEVSSSLIDIDGTPCILSLIRDITERRRVERLKTEFISVVSHELRTPLTSIRGSLGLITAGVTGAVPDQARQLLQIALQNSERLVRLINDLLDIEKIEAGRIEFDLRPLDLADLVSQAIAANVTYAMPFGVKFELADNPAGVRVIGDSDRLMQVMANLLSNAAKFSPRNGRVIISVERRPGRARVSVRDRGAGIPEEFRSRIFQRFAQAQATRGDKSGSGLGLSICKAIVERLGGRLEFESEVGAGTTFWFELPEMATGAPPAAEGVS